MKKLTTEQLLFAHRIGATHSRNEWSEGLFSDVGDDSYKYWNTSVNGWVKAGSPNFKYIEKIDFTPLYDWIDHDGGECPVLPDDVVVAVGASGNTVQIAASELDWRNIKCFMLYRAADWPEQRADAIGQNGNTGEHYDMPPPEYDPRDVAFKPKISKYHREIAPWVWVDVYDVLKAWNVTCPALQHLIKKALQPGERGHKTLDQDMKDIVASAIRAQELASNPED